MTGFLANYIRNITAGVELNQVLAQAVPFQVPLKVPFRGVTHREGMLLSGPSGWGEFAPFVEYDDQTASSWLLSALEAAYGQWPEPTRTRVPVNAIIPALDPERAAALAVAAWQTTGTTTFKIKVAGQGATLAQDCARVAAVRAAVDQQLAQAAKAAGTKPRLARIRVDANGGWNYREALTAIAALDEAAKGLEYVEQPCLELADVAQVRRNSVAMIAVDESIRTAEDPVRIANGSIADILVLKAPPLGGVAAALEVVEAARVPVVISGAMDTSVGLSSALALAGSVAELPFACGLGTGELLARDVVARPVVPTNGELAVTRIEPDKDQLELAQATIPPDRITWWQERLTRVWEQLMLSA